MNNNEENELFDLDIVGNVIGNLLFAALFPDKTIETINKKMDYIILKLNEIENKIDKE